MQLLYGRHLGPDWIKQVRNPETWESIEAVDDAELWETQQVLKARLIDFVRRRLTAQAQKRDEGAAAIERAQSALDLNALTIGFARRFATYKRAGLVLQDVERLIEMIHSSDRPIQFIFAGKAHPEGSFWQGTDSEHRPPDPQGRAVAPYRLRRRLRYQRGSPVGSRG